MTHAVVVGAGLGGLAAAIRLRAMGHEVTVVEANPDPGGRARVFSRDGFVYDAGPTVITAPYLLDELFALVGRDRRDYITLLPVDPFYRVRFPDGSSFDYVGDEDRLLDQIRAMSPRDVDGYRQLAAHAKRIFDIGYLKLAHVPFDRLSDMLRVAPDMIRLQNYRSVYSLVARYLRDERLRQVFTFQPLLVGGNPFRTSSIYLLIHWLEREWGVHFAEGGTGSIVRGLVQLLGELGVEVRCGAPVAEIEVDRGVSSGVRLESGERIAADVVVANADPSTVYRRLIDPKHRSKHTDRRVGRVKQSMGLFVGYFGTDRQWPDLAHHEILLGPRYKDLLTDIFDNKVLADDFSLYLHAPGRTDPSLAPAGKDGLYVLSPVPNTESGIDWERHGDAYFDRILGAIEQMRMPGLRDSLVHRFHVTPTYFEQDLRSTSGAGFGPEPVLTQSAWFRYHNRSEDVDGLYFVGAGTHPGAGVPGVLSSAKVLERVVPMPEAAVPVPMARVAR